MSTMEAKGDDSGNVGAGDEEQQTNSDIDRQEEEQQQQSDKTETEAEEEEEDDKAKEEPQVQPVRRHTQASAAVSASSSSASASASSGCIMFHGVTYLGCSSVNSPKSEAEIARVMSDLNEPSHEHALEVIMSVPQSINEHIVLYDAEHSDVHFAEHKMSMVLFVMRGTKGSPEASCFAFTTCHGDSIDNMMFSCHVFRCQLADAVSKILYSFWTVFNRQQQQQQQQQQQARRASTQQQHKAASGKVGGDSALAAGIVAATTGQLSSVASSLFGQTSV